MSNPLGCELIGVLGKAKTVYVEIIPIPIPIEEIKSYIRPLSSMTKEEILYCIEFFTKYERGVKEESISEYLDWIFSHHFDINHLIEKGLAIEFPKEMYNI